MKKEVDKKIEEEKADMPTKQATPLKRITRKRMKRNSTKFEEAGICKEEEKMLSLALRNSIRQQQASSSKDFSKVKDMQVFYPSEEEFKDPIKYIETLFYEDVWKFGVIKIIPPPSFKPEFSFNAVPDKKMPTRFQTLQDLSQGKVKKWFCDIFKVHNMY